MLQSRLLVIWDGSPIHRRAAVKDFVEASKGKVWLESLPSYAPDLNPWDEGGWNHLKHFEMRNLVCHDLEELHEQFHFAIGRLRQKPRMIQSFFAQAGLRLGKLNRFCAVLSRPVSLASVVRSLDLLSSSHPDAAGFIADYWYSDT